MSRKAIRIRRVSGQPIFDLLESRRMMSAAPLVAAHVTTVKAAPVISMPAAAKSAVSITSKVTGAASAPKATTVVIAGKVTATKTPSVISTAKVTATKTTSVISTGKVTATKTTSVISAGKVGVVTVVTTKLGSTAVAGTNVGVHMPGEGSDAASTDGVCVATAGAIGTLVGAGAGAVAGSAAGGVGAVPGAQVGGMLGGAVGTLIGAAVCGDSSGGTTTETTTTTDTTTTDGSTTTTDASTSSSSTENSSTTTDTSSSTEQNSSSSTENGGVCSPETGDTPNPDGNGVGGSNMPNPDDSGGGSPKGTVALGSSITSMTGVSSIVTGVANVGHSFSTTTISATLSSRGIISGALGAAAASEEMM